MEPYETFSHAGLKVELHYDEDPEPPDWGMDIVKVFHWHKRYDLLGTRGRTDLGQDETELFIDEAVSQGGVVAPLYMYEHGLISVSLGDYGDPWDSGPVGFVYMEGKDVKAEYNGDIGRAYEYIKGVVEAWDDFYGGRVHGYVVKAFNGDHLDSCWGYYGDEEYVREEAKAAAEHWREKLDGDEPDSFDEARTKIEELLAGPENYYFDELRQYLNERHEQLQRRRRWEPEVEA